MLKVYTVQDYYKVDGEDWQKCGVGGTALRDDARPLAVTKLSDACFAEVYGKLLRGEAYNGLYCGQTLCRHRPYIEVYTGWFCDNPRRFYAKDFQKLSYEYRYEEWPDCSLEWIMKHASAEQTIQYMKERGMTVCPLR